MRSSIFLLALAASLAAAGPAEAGDPMAFAAGDTLKLGGLDVELGHSQERWMQSRGGSVALDDNTFLFGREDTYRTPFSDRGIAEAATGATIGIGMKFRFSSGL